MHDAERPLFPERTPADARPDPSEALHAAAADASSGEGSSVDALAALAEAEGVPTADDRGVLFAPAHPNPHPQDVDDMGRPRIDAPVSERSESPAPNPQEDPQDLSKRELINRIRVRNRSAAPEFLAGFDEPELRAYLDRLTGVLGKRGRGSVWVRPAGRPAITWPKPVAPHARRAAG